MEGENYEAKLSCTNNYEVVWYCKIRPVVLNIRMKSLEIVVILGLIFTLDKIMIRYSGWSIETHWIKNKPIKQGFNFCPSYKKDL